jgi:hypothetical protein
MPHYGNASVVYLITLSGKHITVRSDYAIVRKGGVILALLEGNESRRETWRVNPLRGCLHVKIKPLLTRAA